MKINKRSFFDISLFKTRITSANVKFKEMLLGYFVGPFFAFISNAVFGSYLNRYYSDVLGWTNKTQFGYLSVLLPIISVIFVILGNLLVGKMIDRTRTSQGKARPWLFISSLLVTLAIILLLSVPIKNVRLGTIWICISYNLYYAIAYPFFYASHSSMVALSTRNPKHRGLLSTFSNASNIAAVGLIANIITPIFFQRFLFVTNQTINNNGEIIYIIDAFKSYNNWRIFMIAICILSFIGILLEYFYTRERITEESYKLNIKESKISIMQQICN